MLTEITESYITKYSCPMVAYIANGHFNEESGDVESSTGWFARAGKWVIVENSQGFVDGEKFATIAGAKAWFAVLDTEFVNWAITPYEDEETS